MNSSEKNFCDRIKDLREKLDGRYVLVDALAAFKTTLLAELDGRYLTAANLQTFKTGLIAELDGRYAKKGESPAPIEGDDDTDTDTDSDSDIQPTVPSGGRRSPTYSVSPSSLYITNGQSKNTTVTTNSDGAISATSADANIIKTSVNGKVVTLSRVADSQERTAISVSAAATDNFYKSTQAVYAEPSQIVVTFDGTDSIIPISTDNPTVNAPSSSTTISSAKTKVPIVLNGNSQLNKITTGDSDVTLNSYNGADITLGAGNATIHWGIYGGDNIKGFEPAKHCLDIDNTEAYITASSLQGNNLIFTHERQSTTYVTLQAGSQGPVEKVPVHNNFDGSTSSAPATGFMTKHGYVAGSTLSLFQNPANANINLNSDTLYSGITNIDANRCDLPVTLVADSINARQYSTNHYSTTFEFRAGNATINNFTSRDALAESDRLKLVNTTISDVQNGVNDATLTCGSSQLVLKGCANAKIYTNNSAGQFKLYDLAAKDWV